MMPPVMVFCVTGLTHLIYCIWSIRSLRAQSYTPIEVIVAYDWERDFLGKHLDDTPCTVAGMQLEGFRMWAFRPFALERYTIRSTERDVVICDADILWKASPAALFERFEGKPWIHKITAMNPADLDMTKIPERRIGLRTMAAYKRRVRLTRYTNFHLNCGLFMLPKDVWPQVLQRWTTAIRTLPPGEMIMTEALLALVYGEMGLAPISDRADIKHLGTREDPVAVPITHFEIADPGPGELTGYQTATHYFGDQRPMMHRDVVEMGLDPDNLLALVLEEQRGKWRRNWIDRIKTLPKKALRRVLRA